MRTDKTAADRGTVILGTDSALVREGDAMHLYTVMDGRVRRIGKFADAGSAWAALDALEPGI